MLNSSKLTYLTLALGLPFHVLKSLELNYPLPPWLLFFVQEAERLNWLSEPQITGNRHLCWFTGNNHMSQIYRLRKRRLFKVEVNQLGLSIQFYAHSYYDFKKTHRFLYMFDRKEYRYSNLKFSHPFDASPIWRFDTWFNTLKSALY